MQKSEYGRANNYDNIQKPDFQRKHLKYVATKNNCFGVRLNSYAQENSQKDYYEREIKFRVAETFAIGLAD